MNEKINQWLKELTFEEKCRILTGGNALYSGSNERLGIPQFNMSDGPQGIRRLLNHPRCPQICNIPGGDTCFPSGSALASTWNRDLIYKVGHALADDCHQENVDVLLAPAINMKRTPLCGRNFEYYSEDPYLAGEMAGSYIRGLEENDVATCVKHFAANNQERDRSQISIDVDERTLREYYLEAFRIAIEKGKPSSIMCAYNKLFGIWCAENDWLYKEVLKKEWNYDGLVISDWNAVHDSAKSIAAGLDLRMPKNEDIIKELKKGIEDGIIKEEDVDHACARVLQFTMDRISKRKKSYSYNRKNQHQIAYEASAESIVLLKNEDHILPIVPENYEKIVIFGEPAETPLFMGGGVSVTVEQEMVEKPLTWIKEYCKDKTEIIYEPMYDTKIGRFDNFYKIIGLSKQADLAIVFASSLYQYESEGGDRARITFPENMNDVIAMIHQFFKKVVVVMQTGSVTTGNGWEKDSKALIQMWLSGESGGKAVVDILFGKVNPSGKLAETFCTKLSDHMTHISYTKKISYSEGLDVGYRYFDRHPENVWYPFGHGLSYTSFEYSDLKITPEESENPEQTVTVSFVVKNTGTMSGKEVVQLYVKPEDSTVVRPEKELKEFAKISLAAGESKEVKFQLNAHAFSYYNPCLKKWHVESGNYGILIGASCQDIRLSANYYVKYVQDYTKISEKKAMIL